MKLTLSANNLQNQTFIRLVLTSQRAFSYLFSFCHLSVSISSFCLAALQTRIRGMPILSLVHRTHSHTNTQSLWLKSTIENCKVAVMREIRYRKNKQNRNGGTGEQKKKIKQRAQERNRQKFCYLNSAYFLHFRGCVCVSVHSTHNNRNKKLLIMERFTGSSAALQHCTQQPNINYSNNNKTTKTVQEKWAINKIK